MFCSKKDAENTRNAGSDTLCGQKELLNGVRGACLSNVSTLTISLQMFLNCDCKDQNFTSKDTYKIKTTLFFNTTFIL